MELVYSRTIGRIYYWIAALHAVFFGQARCRYGPTYP